MPFLFPFIPTSGVLRLTRHVIRFLQVGCRDLAPGQYPTHLRLRSTACFRPLSAPSLPSRHYAYTARLPYYIGPPSTSQRRRHSLLYPAVASPFCLQCHPACHAPPPLSFFGNVSARARLLTRLVSLRSDSQRINQSAPTGRSSLRCKWCLRAGGSGSPSFLGRC